MKVVEGKKAVPTMLVEGDNVEEQVTDEKWHQHATGEGSRDVAWVL